MLTFRGPHIVALDDGYDYTKVKTLEKALRQPTAVSLSPRVTVNVLGSSERTAENLYEIDGAVFAVGANVCEPIDTRYEEFPFSAANLAVATDAIRRVLPAGASAHVITGLPLNRYYTPSGEVRNELLARKSNAWQRPVKALRGPAVPVIVKTTILSEAVAAWIDLVISEDMRPKQELVNECTAVVDIGGRTTDVAVFEDGDIDIKRSGTLDHGVLDLSAAVSRALDDRFPYQSPYPRSVLELAVTTGFATLGASKIDLTATLTREKYSLIERVTAFFHRQCGQSTAHIKRILFVGGGSMLFQPEIQTRFPNALLADDAQMANVRGMLKYGHLQRAHEDEVRRDVRLALRQPGGSECDTLAYRE